MTTKNASVDNIIADEEIPKVEQKMEPLMVKNSKRVEQGKRLAEWNKQNKRPKIKMQNDSPASVQTAPMQTAPVQPVHTQEKDNTNYWILGGTIIVGGIAVGLIYFTQRGKIIQSVQIPEAPIQTVEIPAQVSTQENLFDMA
jgi:hypothetical protein